MNRTTNIQWVASLLAWLGAASLLVGLGLFAFAGTFSRFWADDYCYSATIKQLGLFSGIVDWYQHNGNRLSTLVVVAFSDLFGWKSMPFISLAVMVIWFGAWLFFLYQVCRWLTWQVRWHWLVLLALVQVYFAVLLAPDRLQTIYWRMGTFHYTLPMPLLLINLGLLLHSFCSDRKWNLWTALVSTFIAFFAAGLSETFAALQTGILLTGVLAAVLFLGGSRRRNTIRLLILPLVGSLLMMLLMMRAPANAWRQAVLPPPHNLLLIIPFSLRYAADFILYTVRGQIVPFFVLMVGMGGIALFAVPAERVRLSLRALCLGMALSLMVMYAWIVSSFAPSTYAGLAYPAGRALMPGCFILLVGLSMFAGLAGLAVRRIMPAGGQVWVKAGALGLLLILCLYPFRAASIARSDIALLSVKAGRWDARHAQILSSITAHQMDVQVKQVDVVQSLEDMGPSPAQWINGCASIVYGVHSITALP